MIDATSNEKSWRCFHCDQVFTEREVAAAHFGVQMGGHADGVACKINATEGLLVSMLREAQAELRRCADHVRALRRAEEEGYARGLDDAKKHPETLGLGGADT